jgi:1-aminocyclopropane-1-carboxylate deaminase/D-cysteine desulfhydrase-like pyridoxal-dependent ACC family enzyme
MRRIFNISAVVLLTVMAGTNAYIAYKLDRLQRDILSDVEAEGRDITDGLARIAKSVACTNERLDIIQDDIGKIETHTWSVATHLPEPSSVLPAHPRVPSVASCM